MPARKRKPKTVAQVAVAEEATAVRDEAPASTAARRFYKGEPIVRETINLGVGGQIQRAEDQPDVPIKSRVLFQAEADFENVKYSFLDDGGCEEMVILTIDRKTFRVLDVTPPAPKPVQLTLAPEMQAVIERATSNPDEEPDGFEQADAAFDGSEPESEPTWYQHEHRDLGVHSGPDGDKDHDHDGDPRIGDGVLDG